MYFRVQKCVGNCTNPTATPLKSYFQIRVRYAIVCTVQYTVMITYNLNAHVF